MLIVSLDSVSFSGLVWTFKLLLSKGTDISIWHARQFVRNEMITVTVFASDNREFNYTKSARRLMHTYFFCNVNSDVMI